MKGKMHHSRAPAPRPPLRTERPSLMEINYTSSADKSNQPAMFHAPDTGEPVPLIVALHTWDGDYKQNYHQEIAQWCLKNGWAYIHPDFRGSNRRPEATGSELVVKDIVSAVEYAKESARIDASSIYLVGTSGGGYTALVMAGHHPEIWAGVSAWVPISDLKAWYSQGKFCDDMVKSCGGTPGQSDAVDAEYRKRSPLTYLKNARGLALHINAGIMDGHKGSVPISHALLAFNEVADPQDRISADDIRFFVEKAEVPTHLRENIADASYGEKRPLFRRSSGNATVTIFQGDHEMVANAALSWFEKIQKSKEKTSSEEESMSFPREFVWGAAAASYQIEGAADADGKGLSVWDMMCRQPGKVWSGNTGNVACDHYHKYEEDARLMAKIGLKAYRLSISWPRVLPNGIGKINAKGLAFYDRLIDALLENNLQPWVTLFHWDYPYALYCKGGWLNRDSADWFAEYTRVIVDKLSDRVARWMTQNEPQCYIGLGHQTGEHAPGLKLGFADVLLAAHHSLLAHGKAVQVIRAQAKSKPRIGAAPVGLTKTPGHNTTEGIEAARKAMFSITSKDCWNNTWFADPMVFGRYPDDGLELFRAEMPEIKPGDMKTIRQPLDFYGANIYYGPAVQAKRDGTIAAPPSPDGPALTTMEWEITPQSLYWGPRFLYERYKLPIVVTENGMANTDWVHLDGKVHDPQRVDFLTRYLREYHRAITDGIKAEGYFLWSIMDNFEWAHGYKQRFGIVHVDYATGKRTLKDSAYWYKDVIAANGNNLIAEK